MKKAVYFSIMLLTVYLNLVYEWEEGTSVLSVEILFLLFLYGTVRLWKGKIAVLPVGGFQIAEEGEHLDIPFIVENRGKVRTPDIRFRIRGQKFFVNSLGKRRKQTVLCPFEAEGCGRQILLPEKICAADALGMFWIPLRKAEREAAEIRVIPKCYPVFAEITKATRNFLVESDEYDKDRGGDDSSEVFDVRSYRPGDRISRIHWKLSARSDELYMKEFSCPIGASVILFLVRKDEEKGEENQQDFLRIAVSAGRAILDEECWFYTVWKEKRTGRWVRRLIKDEETYYEWLVALAGVGVSDFDRIDEEEYRHEFHEPYRSALFVQDNLTISGTFQEEIRFQRDKVKEKLAETVLII